MKRLFSAPSIALMGLLLWSAPAWAQEGYRLERQRQRVTVAATQEWNQWSLGELQSPLGEIRQDIVEITAEGTVRPRFIRKGIDAVSDASTFSHLIDGKTKDLYLNTFPDGNALKAWGGIKNAGSNRARAANIIDREEDRFETFWEPDLSRPPTEWWVEIDLGRMVSAEKLVLRFVEEELGDPFLQFRVLVSTGEFFFSNPQTLEYRIVGGTTRAVQEQRIFEYTLEPDQKADPHYTGAPLQYVRIVVTDSRKDRAAEVSQETYETLPADQRGAVEYFLKTFDNAESAVSRAEFEGVAPERQGTVRYYRRERPRLADLEVLSVGDNLALGMQKRGGKLEVSGLEGSAPADAFDGNYRSHWKAQVFKEVGPGSERGGILTADFGIKFWMDSYRIIPKRRLLGYVARVSDGSRASNGSLLWEILSPQERESNSALLDRFEDRFDPRLVRFFEFKHLDITGQRSGNYGAQHEIGEFQFFGEGYVPEVVLTSPLMELGGSRNLTRIEWVGQIPPDARIEVRTQTGDELIQVKHFFDKGGKEVTADKYYNQLAGFQRGDSTLTFSAGVDWSPWSKPYERSGDRFLSPTPRQFLKLQATLLSSRPDAFASLDSLIVYFTDPIARQLLAEVTPQIDVRSVEPDTFSLYVRPVFVDQPVRLRSSRFDEILVVASQQTEMEFLELRLGSRDSLLAGGGEIFRPDGQGAFVNPAGERLEVRPARADSLWIRLPRLVDKDLTQDPMYQRIAQEGDEAPIDKQGGVLIQREYNLLPESERGRIDYFQIAGEDSKGSPILRRVDLSAYTQLPLEAQGPIHYYRRLFEGEEVHLDNAGEPLTRAAYNALSSSRRGAVLNEGELAELRFRSRIFVNGTTFTTQVANSSIPDSWQQVDPGDVLGLVEGQGTTVFIPIDDRILHSLEITPNPFTPNGDGINDRLRLVLSVLKIDASRRIEARFFTLGGDPVATVSKAGVGGQQVLEWDGRNAAGERVPPGLYLCRIHIDADAGSKTALARVVSVVY